MYRKKKESSKIRKNKDICVWLIIHLLQKCFLAINIDNKPSKLLLENLFISPQMCHIRKENASVG